MFKKLVILALMSVVLVTAKTSVKTYTVHFSETVKAGSVDLKAGEYKLKVEGSQVVFTDQRGKQIEASATVESTDRKFDRTSITMSTADGTSRLVSIQLGGSNNTVKFE